MSSLAGADVPTGWASMSSLAGVNVPTGCCECPDKCCECPDKCGVNVLTTGVNVRPLSPFCGVVLSPLRSSLWPSSSLSCGVFMSSLPISCRMVPTLTV
jgi:hypothetical protein